MIKLVTVEEMRRIEAAADRAGISFAQMMDNAGRAVADRVKQIIRDQEMAQPRVAILVGPGNNGGDGLVAGCLIAEESPANVVFFLARPRDDANLTAVRESGLRIIRSGDYDTLRVLIAGADIIIDALLGTGAKLPVQGEIKLTLQHVRATLEGRRAAYEQSRRSPLLTPDQVAIPESEGDKPYIIAVDIPSGVDANTGEMDEFTLRADETITFEAAKYGLFAFPGAYSAGIVHVASLDLPKILPERDTINRTVVDAETVSDLLPKRPGNANKGTFGKALILGGSAAYIGAPGLAALGAYRIGAGLVTVAAPQAVVNVLAAQILETTWYALPLLEHEPPDPRAVTNVAATMALKQVPNYDAMLIGPGMGRAPHFYTLLETLFEYGEGKIPPLVIDADGLNILASKEEWWTRIPPGTILTPHPGEMARLASIREEANKSAAQIVQMNRIGLATSRAAQWNCIVVLKGAYTVVAAPDGRAAIIPFAEPALARAGTGDVLAGIIVGLLAQGLNPYNAAVVGAYVHAFAGRLAGMMAGTRASVLAGDVAATLPMALSQIEAIGSGL